MTRATRVMCDLRAGAPGISCRARTVLASLRNSPGTICPGPHLLWGFRYLVGRLAVLNGRPLRLFARASLRGLSGALGVLLVRLCNVFKGKIEARSS